MKGFHGPKKVQNDAKKKRREKSLLLYFVQYRIGQSNTDKLHA